MIAPPRELDAAVVERARVRARATRSQIARFNRLVLLGFVVALFLVPSTEALRGLKSVGMPAQLFGWLALLAWLSGGLRVDGRLQRGPQPVRVVMGLLVIGSALSYGVAFARPLLPLESGNATRLAYLFLAGIGIALLLADGVLTRSQFHELCETLAFGAYFSGLIGLLQYFLRLNYNQLLAATKVFVINVQDYGTGQFETNIGRGFRAYGTADHAIEFAVVCSSLIPLAVHLACTESSRKRRRLHMTGAALLGMSALISVSRSGVVGLVLGIVVYGCTMPPRRLLNLSAACLAVLVFVQVAAHGVLSTLRYLLFAGNVDPSLAHRSGNTAYIAPLLRGHEWFGIGFGTYQPVVYRVLDNQYLVTLVCSGVIGLVAQILLYLFAATLARAGRRSYSSEADRGIGQALAAGVLVLGVSAAFYDQFAFRQSALLLFALIGLIGAYWRLGKPSVAGAPITSSRSSSVNNSGGMLSSSLP